VNGVRPVARLLQALSEKQRQLPVLPPLWKKKIIYGRLHAI
jgi:hypothetical protein